MVINKAFKSEIHINDSLKSIFNQFLGNRRFIYNQLLSIVENSPIKSINLYGEKTYSIKSRKNLQEVCSYLSDKYDFLSNSHSQSNQEASHALQKAFSKHSKIQTKKDPNKGKPKFKSKKDDQGFFLPNQNNIYLFDNYLECKPFDKFFFYQSATSNPLLVKKPLIDKKHINSFRKIFIRNPIPDEVRNATITGITISKSKKKYFVSINYKYINEVSPIEESYITNIYSTNGIGLHEDYVKNQSKRIVGIDLGLKDKLILSNGIKYSGINNDSKYKELIVKQKSLQKSLSKIVQSKKKKELDKRYKDGYKSINKKDLQKLKKSKKRDKYKDVPKKFDLYKLFLENNLTILSKDYKFEKSFWKNVYKNYKIKSLSKEIFKIELKLKNKRKDENHKISKEIVDNNDFIFMEDLTLKGMQNLWGNKIKQLGLSQLTMFIKYKAENQGKIFSKIDRFYPSSKTCCNCGNKKNLLLSDRIYSCEKCNINIDRDINAAINILLEGIKKLIIEKELNPSIINIGDLKDYLIEKLNDTSKVVDEKKISDNLLRKPQH